MQQHPELIMMYQHAQAEVDRLQAVRNPRVPSSGTLSTMRVLMGNALIALGTRIAPAPRPVVMRQASRPALAR